MLTEDTVPVQEAKVEVQSERGNIYRVYTRRDIIALLDKSYYGQLRGVFSYRNNEMFVADANQMTHEDIQDEAAVVGNILFTLQYNFGNAPKIDLGDNISMMTSADEDDLVPAFARVLGLTMDELAERFRLYEEAH